MQLSKFSECGCPLCHNQLAAVEESLLCTACEKSWLLEGEIPVFVDGDFYWGEIPQDTMRNVNKAAVSQGWKRAVDLIIRPSYPKIYDYIVNASRIDWRYQLPIESSWVALDVGSGWGSLSFLLAKICKRVYSVECVKERLDFQSIRKQQENIKNLQVIKADVFNLPFKKESLDLIVMNGVLEWVGLTNKHGTPYEDQLKGLEICHSLLKEKGYLYVGIENRLGYSYFLGAKDHSGLRFTSLMPRRLADVYCRLIRGKLYFGISRPEYRTYTYTYWGYKELLKRAGFKQVRIVSCIPSYSDPRYIIPLDDKRMMEFFIKHHFPQNSAKRKLIYVLARLAAFFSAHPVFMGHFCIYATK
jgi:2-polyprenyl-3-methyl-5-hydroxy-6-metoxy-1,4-benzoquinol methylase